MPQSKADSLLSRLFLENGLRRLAAAIVAVVILAIASNLMKGTPLKPPPPPPALKPPPVNIVPVDVVALHRKEWEKIAPALLQAELEGQKEIEHRVKQIATFVEERRKGVPTFAANVLSLKGKWKVVRGALTSAGKDENIRFIGEKFSETIFTPGDLSNVVDDALKAYQATNQEIEDKLLVKCRADISELEQNSNFGSPSYPSDESFKNAFDECVENVIPVLAKDIGVETAKLIASWLAIDFVAVVGTQTVAAVATALGVDAGILGTGGALGPETFGISIVAAIVADIAVDWIARLVGLDGVTRVSTKVNEVLDKLQTLLVSGDPAALGDYEILRKLAKNESDAAVREAANEAIFVIEKSGKLGVREVLLQLNENRARLREAALKRLVFQGEEI